MSFALTIFISSFFLFQIQPIIARYILPWYGGSPTVWSTCMLFFQLGLLAGYIYAHLLARYLQQRQQVFLHITLLLLSLLWLPITPDPALKPSGTDDPVWGIIQLLFLTVGTPYILISSTGPLLQHWYRLKYRNRSPYRLYALSNVGSLLGLISYPFLVEPNMALGSQTFFWSCGYFAFFFVCLWSGWSLFSAKRTDPSALHVNEITAPSSAQRSQAQSQARPLLWIGLSACASVLFLAVTSKITQDVSVIPFLWVVPLSLYLCTLIIAFDSPRWYRRRIWLPAFLVSCGLVTYLQHPETELHILWTIFLYSLALFCIVMVCHGELARSKPPAHQLTSFYLMISLGGALGGAFVSFVATNLFPAYWELEIGVGMALLLVGFTLFCSSKKSKKPKKKVGHWLSVKKRTWAVYSLYSIYSIYSFAIIVLLINSMVDMDQGTLTTQRNFYGVLRVDEQDKGTKKHRRKLYNGQINHGMQLLYPTEKYRILSYYSAHSGIGIAFRHHPKRLRAEHTESTENTGGTQQDNHLEVGVIGLGIGLIASWGEPDDTFRFYEINPGVVRIADEFFTVLKESMAKTKIILGDGRISLERELASHGSMQFDMLVVDAFSGDAIPIHLITQEALQLYFKHLQPDGILALHISNRHINLKPVVYGLADRMDIPAILIKKRRRSQDFIKGSEWILMTRNAEFFDNIEVVHYMTPWPSDLRDDIIWTDDYSSLVHVLK